MKKYLLIFVFLMLNMGLQAAVKIDGIWYEMGGWATVVRPPEGEVYSGTVDIPGRIEYNGDYYSVESIGELAFAGFSNLTIKMGNSSMRIAPNAFNDCSDLTIDVPSLYAWLSSIRFVYEDGGHLGSNDRPMQFVKSLVIGGEELKDLDLTEISVKTFSDLCFSGYRGLRSVIIPKTMNKIPSAFSYCTGLKTVKVNDGVESLGGAMFKGCTALTDVELPSSLTVIPEELFNGCSGLETIQLPENLKEIERKAFNGCEKLSGIIFQESLRTIGENAFMNCESIIDLQFPSSKLIINSGAFSNANGIKELNIPKNVSLGSGVFGNCKGLEILHSSGKLGGYDFRGCTGLKTAYISSSDVISHSFENCTSLNFVELEDGVESIGYNAFDGCASLKTIKFPITLRSNYCSFSGCDELEYFDIKSIDAWNKMENATSLFNGGRHLRLNGWEVVKEVHVSEGTTKLADDLYAYNEDITQVHLPSTLSSIKGFKYCPNITGIYCYSEERIPYLDDFQFGQNMYLYKTEEERNQYLASVTVYVRGNLLEAFKADRNWGKFGRITAISGTEEKCAAPEITYENGKLFFQCDTPDAEITTTIKDSDMGTFSGNEIQLTATYIIRAYATAKDHIQSEVNVATLCWIDANPKIETRIIDTEEVKAQPVLIQCCNGQLVISGVREGQHIALYSVTGEKLNATIASCDKVTFTSPCQGNKMIIVQIEDKSIKVAGNF